MAGPATKDFVAALKEQASLDATDPQVSAMLHELAKYVERNGEPAINASIAYAWVDGKAARPVARAQQLALAVRTAVQTTAR